MVWSRRAASLALVTCCVVELITTTVTAGDDDTSDVELPEFDFLRQNEDWSVLSQLEPEQQAGRFDRMKYIPVSAGDEDWISVGGSFRLRYESWRDFAFGAPPNDTDGFLLARLLAHADFHLHRRSRIFLELKAAQSTPRELPGGTRALDVDSFDLQQGFVDVDVGPEARGQFVLRVGRQALSIGRQRLVSPLPWGNSLRSWDGVTMTMRPKGWNVAAFWTAFAPVLQYEFNEPDADWQFSGTVASRLGRRFNFEAYALWLDRGDPVTFNGTTGPESRYTVGGRGWTTFGRGRIDVEIARQLGSVGAGDIEATMATVELNLELARFARLIVGVDYASGDRSPGGDVETFNQLFPLGHAYLGYLDVVGRQNVLDASVGLSFRPVKRLEVFAMVHLLQRAESTDAVYNPGGGVVIPATAGTSRDIGTELDTVFRYTPSRYTLIELGLGRLFAGELPEQAGSGEDIDFAYLQFEYRF